MQDNKYTFLGEENNQAINDVPEAEADIGTAVSASEGQTDFNESAEDKNDDSSQVDAEAEDSRDFVLGELNEDAAAAIASETSGAIPTAPEDADHEESGLELTGRSSFVSDSGNEDIPAAPDDLLEDTQDDIPIAPDGLVEDVSDDEEEDSTIEWAGGTEPKGLSSTQIRRRQRELDNEKRTAMRRRREQERVRAAAVWSELGKSKRYNNICTGKLIGCKMMSDRVLAVVVYEGFKVLIDFQDFFVEFPITRDVDTSTEDGLMSLVLRERAMVERMYGAEIPFIVKRRESDKKGAYVILGSRAEALKKIMVQTFTPDENGDAVMAAGDTVPAKILSVGDHALLVNVGGIDNRIPLHFLTYRYIPTAIEMEEYYHVGQEILVSIRGIMVNKAGNIVCQLDGRRAEMEDAKSRHHMFDSPGDMAYAVISNIFRKKDGSVMVLLYIEDLALPATAYSVRPDAWGKYPSVGSRVRVSFQRYNEDTGMTFVTIRGTHGVTRL